MRFHGYHQAMRKIVASGRIGQVVSMRAQFTCWYPKAEGAWRQDPALSGGGALMDMGIHCIDLLQYISGLKPVECRGFAHNQTFGYPSDDSASLVMRMENGALACVESNFNIPDAAAKCPLEIYGTKGSLIALGTLGQEEGGSVELRVCDGNAGYDALQSRGPVRSEVLSVPLGNMYTKEIESFSEAVLRGETPAVNGRDTLISQRVIEAVYREGGGIL